MNDNAKALVAALRSGNFKQTQRHLADQNGHCCLGVACEIALVAGILKDGDVQTVGVEGGDGFYKRYSGNSQVLPYHVADWLGFHGHNSNGAFDYHALPEKFKTHPYIMQRQMIDAPPEGAVDKTPYKLALSELNDHGFTFEEIAEIIEAEPKGLFADPPDSRSVVYVV